MLFTNRVFVVGEVITLPISIVEHVNTSVLLKILAQSRALIASRTKRTLWF